MRINAHCHIFNLQSVFTKGTKQILKDRLERTFPHLDLLPTLVLEPLEKYLESQEESELEGFDSLVEAHLRAQEPAAGGAEGDTSCGLWDSVKDWLGVSTVDAFVTDHRDIVEFVNVALKTSMDRTTDCLFDNMADGQRAGAVDRGELLITPLMMDILSDSWKDKSSEQDEKELALLRVQQERTIRQSIRYPGRVLPFYAVHPWRPNCLKLLGEALGPDGGFVGMKVYPSLGYDVSELAEALAYCNDHEVPVMTHCNNGGFKAKEDFGRLAHPRCWERALEENTQLKVCFGHFGGEEFFREEEQDYRWGRKILELMEKFPGRVFADISYHTGGMGGFGSLKKYMRHLTNLLEHKTYGEQILFGTDFFLVLQRISEDNYWDFYKDRLETRHFEKLARKNPLRFLGLNAAQPSRSSTNIMNHIAFLTKARETRATLWESGGVRANWLRLVPGLQ